MSAVRTEGPYESTALEYVRAAWAGVLPITGKFPPPKGTTGADAPWPSTADVMSWSTGPEGSRNIGLRPPPHVIGIDVDDYDGKHGGATLGDAEVMWGPLPATWITTSRTDGVSGIRLFTVPTELKWPGALGLAVEIIQTRHRYAMVWPSIHPDTGATYRWLDPAGHVSERIPHADELPLLPEAWIDGLTHGERARDIAKVELSGSAVGQWLAGMSSYGDRCPVMHTASLRALADLAHGVSRHDAAMRASARLTLLRAEGHTGLGDALSEVRAAFLAAVAAPNRDGVGEWQRMIEGAVQMAAARPPAPLDPCALMGGVNYGPPGIVTPPRLTVVPNPPNLFPIGEQGPELAHWQVPAAPGIDPALDPAVALELHVQRTRRAAKSILDGEEHARRFREPPFVPDLTAELALPDEPVSWRIGELLPLGGNVLFTAQYKSGKTTTLNHCVKCLADGVPFLGLLPVAAPTGRIAIFNYEVSREQNRRWLRDAGVIHTERVSVLNLRGYSLPLMTPRVTEWVVRWLAEHEIEVWMLDPWARAAVGSVTSENDNTEVGALLDHLDVIKARAGVRELMLAAHTGRGEMEDGQERARGATRLDDWADVRWFLTKDPESGQRFFRASGRDVEYEEKALQFDEPSRGLQIVGGSRKDARGDRVKNAARAAIMNTPGISGKALENAVRVTLGKSDDKVVRAAVTELEHDGEIIVTRQGIGLPTLHRMAPPRSPFGPVR